MRCRRPPHLPACRRHPALPRHRPPAGLRRPPAAGRARRRQPAARSGPEPAVPARAQRLALLVRDGPTCVFPGCDRPISWTNVHHFVPWEHGGPTNLDHLGHLCDPHHHLVHEGGWKLTRHEDGRITAISPDGTVLTAHPRIRGRPTPPAPEPAQQLTLQGCGARHDHRWCQVAPGQPPVMAGLRALAAGASSWRSRARSTPGPGRSRRAPRRWKAGSPLLGSAATTTLQP